MSRECAIMCAVGGGGGGIPVGLEFGIPKEGEEIPMGLGFGISYFPTIL